MEQRTTIVNLPLFPLGLVLFPGQSLPLHIFEERYKRMIGRCLAEDRSFGIVLLRGGQTTPCEIGTVAQIVDHARMADGRYNIVTRGTSRFQVLESRPEPSGYLTARVELLEEDEGDTARLAGLQAAVQRRFEALVAELAKLTGSQTEPIAFPPDPTAVSYFVASHLPVIEDWEQQHLLEASSTDLRLALERRILGRECDVLRRFATARAPYEPVDGAPENEGDRIIISPN